MKMVKDSMMIWMTSAVDKICEDGEGNMMIWMKLSVYKICDDGEGQYMLIWIKPAVDMACGN